ncbi:MAG: ethylbenzene dehydrogenase-related protein [bacterium]|nr:ethylbenzene dehydrogenase-related protein [bacterium]
MINKPVSIFLFFLILVIELIFPSFMQKIECKEFPAIIMISLNRSIIKTIARDSLGQEQDKIIKDFGKTNIHIKNFSYTHVDTSVLFNITTANYQFIGTPPPGVKKEMKITFSCSKFTLYKMSMADYEFKDNDMNEFNVGGNPIEFKIIPESDSYNFYFTYNITPEEQIIPKVKEIKKEEPKSIPKEKTPPVKKDNVVYSYETNLTPVIDGKESDSAWDIAPFTIISLSGNLDIQNIQVKSIHTKEKIFFIFKWQDFSNDYLHRLWVWDKNRKTYLENDSREDRLVIKFSINSNFASCPDEGIDSIADIWDWRAALTNPSGFADDKKEIMSLRRLPRSYEVKTKNNKKIYLQYLPDEGNSPYRQDIATAFSGETIPQFLTQKPSGSRADVLASGSWDKNYWVVEFERTLTTSDTEDVQFNSKDNIDFLIAVYNHSELSNHNFSQKLNFIFK